MTTTLQTSNPFTRYLALGWSVIPIKRGTKIPQAELLPEVADPEAEGSVRRSWKPFQERHPTTAEIDAWSHHLTNLAVVVGAISGVIVLDLDSDVALRAATERGLPRTATARSSKGPHLYFKHPGGRVRNYRDETEQWDLKGDGGLVNAPPSIHPTGVMYEWELPPEEVGIAEAPDWLLEIIRAQQDREAQASQDRPRSATLFEGDKESTDEATRRRALYFERALNNTLDTLRQAGDGNRNHTLNTSAYSLGQLIAGAELEGANPQAKSDADRLETQVREALLTTALGMGLARREAELTIASGIRSGKQKPRTLPDFTTPSLKSTTTPSDPPLSLDRRDPSQRPARDKAEQQTEESHGISFIKGKEKPNEANLIIELGKSATFFHTPLQERYVRYPVGTRFDTAQINHPKSPFRLWLHRLYYDVVGEPPSPGAMTQALEHFEQIALYKGEEREVFTRIAAVEEVVYLNIGDAEHRIVRIDAEGWEVVREAPVLFRVTRNVAALPLPVRGGSLDLLRPFVNVASDADWKLAIGWMIGALNPWGPYAHLVLKGEQDTGKSTLLRILRRFTDPAQAAENADPKSEDDFMVTTLNNHVVSYDNLSSIPKWLSDGLCRIATGAGLIKRKLFKDLEEVVIAVSRPALLNGIADLITRPDLLDRTIILELERMTPERRRTERALKRELEAIAPQVMGALLDAVVMALRNLDSVKLSRLPRMADFVTWVEAAAPALGWKHEAFLGAYEGNIDAKEIHALESDEVAYTLIQWAEHRIGDTNPHPLAMTMTALLQELNTFEDEGGEAATKTLRFSPDWPKTPRDLTSHLARIQPILRKFGVQVVRGKHTKRGALYTISRRQASLPAHSP